MSSYRNAVANLTQPKSKLDHTAVVLLDLLRTNPTDEKFASEVRTACDVHPLADRAYIPIAKKALCNMGYTITTHKARHLSWYSMAADVDEVTEHHLRIAREQYSERVSWVRSMHDAAHDPAATAIVVNLYNEGVMQAMGLARQLGISPAAVVVDCEPLSV